MAADFNTIIGRLLDAAHKASELLDGCPDDEAAAAASTELSEAAAAVDAMLLRIVPVDLDPATMREVRLKYIDPRADQRRPIDRDEE